MSQACYQCGTVNTMGARFCQNCGATVGATSAQGRTLIAPSFTPEVDVATIVQRANERFGNTAVMPGPINSEKGDQRELTFFVTDYSLSMGESFGGGQSKLQATMRACVNLVLNKAKIDAFDEIGLIVFNSRAQVLHPLASLMTQKRQILERLQTLAPNNGTDINEGLKAARDAFDWHRNDVTRRIILLTDGHGGNPLRTADELKSRGVVIDVIGVGEKPNKVDEKLLRKVASVIEGETRYRFIKDQQTLVDHYTSLANKTATC